MKTTVMIIPILLTVSLLVPTAANAHCDAIDGPVVTAAKKSLSTKDVTPVLKWIEKEKEKEIEAVFKKTLTVRQKGPEARELADLYFFETLVRLHRAGEGAPYTGLKPSGTPQEPIIEEADKALKSGSIDHLAKQMSRAVETGIRKRFEHALEAKKLADRSVSDGREFVAAYVEFVHFAKRLHNDVSSSAHHAGSDDPLAKNQHHH